MQSRLLFDGEDQLQRRPRQLRRGQQRERARRPDAVVRAQRRAGRGDPAVLSAWANGVFQEVVLDLRTLLADHVEMRLDCDGGLGLSSIAGWDVDDDVAASVVLPGGTMKLRGAAEVVHRGPLV